MENKTIEKPSLLLHSCCGPCSTVVVERLSEQYRITLFFYNPNITDFIEYKKRLQSQKLFLDYYNNRTKGDEIVGLIEGDYERDNFYEETIGLEEEPEGGRRCENCFLLRLKKTAEEAKNRRIEYFGTTLSVSPHKKHYLLSQIGTSLGNELGLNFLTEDFKKKAGFQRSIELSKKYGLYRQSYCGCEFSNRERGA